MYERKFNKSDIRPITRLPVPLYEFNSIISGRDIKNKARVRFVAATFLMHTKLYQEIRWQWDVQKMWGRPLNETL